MSGHAGKAVTDAGFGNGTGLVWLDEVTCRGRESRLDQCQYRPWGKTTCGHNEDAGVVCISGKWHLVVCK